MSNLAFYILLQGGALQLPLPVQPCPNAIMMNEEHTQNGRINDQSEEEVHSEIAVSTPDINSPRPSLTTPPSGDPAMEFFDQKVGGSDSGSAEGGSPRMLDNVSHHSHSYVTVSPSVSPGTWSQGGGL